MLDEPSIGLHPRDTGRLIDVLKALRDQGNTVRVVEHDRAIIKGADDIIDLGPGAGEQGGRVVFQGSYPELMSDGRSLTAKYLRGELQIPVPAKRRKGNGLALSVRGARAHNLKGIDVKIPLGALTCVTGVSGSGKSTLVHGRHLRRAPAPPGPLGPAVGAHDAIEGRPTSTRSSWSTSPRSAHAALQPVTYLKGLDGIRELFAATRDARPRPHRQRLLLQRARRALRDLRGRRPGPRRHAVPGRRLARVRGLRRPALPRRVLEVRYKGRSIDQVLEMTVHEAVHFFSGQPAVVRRLKLFEEIGLGYLRLGQSATTLSGGEAQRIKLARTWRARRQRVLYVLDEPTTGLHLGDINELLGCFHRLLEAGATLLVIEHNMDVVKQADWVIDLGPEGGREGGRLVFQGRRRAGRHAGVSLTTLSARRPGRARAPGPRRGLARVGSVTSQV